MFAEPPPPDAPQTEQPLPRRTFTFSDLLLGLIPLALIGGLVLLATGVEIDRPEDPEPTITTEGLIATIVIQLLLALTVGLVALRRRLGPRALGAAMPPRIGLAVGGLFLVYAVLAVYSLVIFALEFVDDERWGGGNPIPIEADPELTLVVLMGFAVVIVAPLCEELFFRAFLFRALWSVGPAPIAIVLSGFAFGVFHFNIAVLIPFTVIGMIFAWIYLRSGSLWTPILAHAMVNGISFALTVSGVADQA
jgi:uncharacterized protein